MNSSRLDLIKPYGIHAKRDRTSLLDGTNLSNDRMDKMTTNHILIGIEKLRKRAHDFEHIFDVVQPPLTTRWPGLLIWIETHTNYEPWGILIEHNGDIIAAAVLTRYRRFGLWQLGIPSVPCFEPGYFGVLDDTAAVMLARAIRDAAQDFGGPWYLEIHGLPCPDLVVNHLMAACPSSKVQLTEPVPSLLFKPNSHLHNYLSQNTRAVVAKARNRIQHEGLQMIQEWTRDSEQIMKVLPEIYDICRNRDYQKYGSSIIDNPIEYCYHMAIMNEYAKQGLLELLTIRLNEELAAFAVCLLDNGWYLVLTNRASPRWLRYSPGTIANAEVVRYAFEDSHSCGVNWGKGLQRYKLSGDVTLIPTQSIYAWSSPIGHLFHFMLKNMLRLKRDILCFKSFGRRLYKAVSRVG